MYLPSCPQTETGPSRAEELAVFSEIWWHWAQSSPEHSLRGWPRTPERRQRQRQPGWRGTNERATFAQCQRTCLSNTVNHMKTGTGRNELTLFCEKAKKHQHFLFSSYELIKLFPPATSLYSRFGFCFWKTTVSFSSNLRQENTFLRLKIHTSTMRKSSQHQALVKYLTKPYATHFKSISRMKT